MNRLETCSFDSSKTVVRRADAGGSSVDDCNLDGVAETPSIVLMLMLRSRCNSVDQPETAVCSVGVILLAHISTSRRGYAIASRTKCQPSLCSLLVSWPFRGFTAVTESSAHCANRPLAFAFL